MSAELLWDVLQQALLVGQQILLIGLYPMAAILVLAAIKRPYIWALTIMALTTVAITLAISAYQFAVANAAAGYPVSQDIARVVLRIALILIEALPLVFFWVYKTKRFRDGH